MTDPRPAAASVSPRRRPRFSTIIWGFVLLIFAVYMVLRSVTQASLDPTFWLLGAVITLGLILVVAGIVTAVRRSAD